METKKITITTTSLEETQTLGNIIGKALPGSTIITLSGDLGSGKTSFTQGLARGLEVPEEYYVTSPTYNIINDYPGRHTLYHIDLYRIGDEEELYDIGFEEIISGDGVVAVEWAEKLHDDYLTVTMNIELKYLDADSREIIITLKDPQRESLFLEIEKSIKQDL